MEFLAGSLSPEQISPEQKGNKCGKKKGTKGKKIER
jgi:hypothetical protein